VSGHGSVCMIKCGSLQVFQHVNGSNRYMVTNRFSAYVKNTIQYHIAAIANLENWFWRFGSVEWCEKDIKTKIQEMMY
jgi:hypothetical protein